MFCWLYFYLAFVVIPYAYFCQSKSIHQLQRTLTDKTDGQFHRQLRSMFFACFSFLTIGTTKPTHSNLYRAGKDNSDNRIRITRVMTLHTDMRYELSKLLRMTVCASTTRVTFK